MKRHINLILLAAVVLLAIIPLWIVPSPAPTADGDTVEIFTGSDDQAEQMIGKISPDYEPWFSPLIEPASGEIESLLFALQAAIGAGFIGYYLGAARTRDQMQRDREQAEAGRKDA
jgi:cobalt/nickel transport protein